MNERARDKRQARGLHLCACDDPGGLGEYYRRLAGANKVCL